jgi:hypothetical protein
VSGGCLTIVRVSMVGNDNVVLPQLMAIAMDAGSPCEIVEKSECTKH